MTEKKNSKDIEPKISTVVKESDIIRYCINWSEKTTYKSKIKKTGNIKKEEILVSCSN